MRVLSGLDESEVTNADVALGESVEGADNDVDGRSWSGGLSGSDENSIE